MFMLLPCMLSGCGAIIVAGAGAGAYTYYSGNVTRTYTAEYQKTINTCLKVLSQMELRVVNRSGDEFKTKIESGRYDDTDITIEIEKIGSNLSRVNIRTGLIGVDQKTESEFIHERIASQLDEKVTPVVVISPDSHKVKFSPSDAGGVTATGSYKKSRSFEREQNVISPESSLPESTQQIIPARKPLYIFYKDKEIEIPRSSLTQLESIIDFLLNNQSSTVEIESYTDSQGKAEDNLSLSWKRAKVINEYLVQKGIHYERITARGFGASNFLWSNRTETLRKMNRRVVLYVNQ